jgi:hypothetical protein
MKDIGEPTINRLPPPAAASRATTRQPLELRRFSIKDR